MVVDERDNGFLRLRAGGGVTLYVHIRAESPRSTVISLVGRCTRPLVRVGRNPDLYQLLVDLRSDIERETPRVPVAV